MRHRNRALALRQRRWGMLQCPRGGRRAHLAAADRTLHCQSQCRGQQNQQYAFRTPLFEDAAFSSVALNAALACRCGGCDLAECVTCPLAKEHEQVNGKSARCIGHVIQRAQTAMLLHRNAAMSQHGHYVNVAASNRADLHCDGSLG